MVIMHVLDLTTLFKEMLDLDHTLRSASQELSRGLNHPCFWDGITGHGVRTSQFPSTPPKPQMLKKVHLYVSTLEVCLHCDQLLVNWGCDLVAVEESWFE